MNRRSAATLIEAVVASSLVATLLLGGSLLFENLQRQARINAIRAKVKASASSLLDILTKEARQSTYVTPTITPFLGLEFSVPESQEFHPITRLANGAEPTSSNGGSRTATTPRVTKLYYLADLPNDVVAIDRKVLALRTTKADGTVTTQYFLDSSGRAMYPGLLSLGAADIGLPNMYVFATFTTRVNDPYSTTFSSSSPQGNKSVITLNFYHFVTWRNR
jgi:hypothetical protein